MGLTLPVSVGKTKIIINKESEVKNIKQYRVNFSSLIKF
jgi:hypothetical protein